ncbi:Asp23/Gls24 family envelope stress response protein [Pseudonocardia sp. HH130630-07]|uniref:Asp23/Gls24 family envelope stress response protein n=1 Tax=Pseudonocardia sp. HH130630-07 TaxID=1690815 RepID=UPI000814C49F|nr:Asp23/Gls24 family envelope stress response protein [Pseudonocardia sp. HH130630-07]ANY06464.1 hypothetical protein AFB00_09360 [Pseudonocardia sp. HH130630-07]
MTSGRWNGDDGSDVLACGRAVDDLVDRVADGRAHLRDAHQRECVHCQAALAEYARLWAPVQDLAAEQVAPPEGRIDTLLRKLRAAVADSGYATIPGPDGVLRIAARVVVVTARNSAQEVRGVRVALSRAVGSAGAGVVAGVAGGSAAVEVTLAADYGEDLHALSARVRQAVADGVRRITGLDTTEITIVIDDVLR